jgi:serine/threonine protein kinase
MINPTATPPMTGLHGPGRFGAVNFVGHTASGLPLALGHNGRARVVMRVAFKKTMSKHVLRQVFLEVTVLGRLERHAHLASVAQAIDYPDMLILLTDSPPLQLTALLAARGATSESEARPLLRQICAAVTFCHENHFVLGVLTVRVGGFFFPKPTSQPTFKNFRRQTVFHWNPGKAVSRRC